MVGTSTSTVGLPAILNRCRKSGMVALFLPGPGSAANSCQSRSPNCVDIGARETGLPVKEMRTLPMTTGFSDGTRAMSAYTEELEVTVLEKAALDSTLFEVPSGYKQVERRQKRLAE
jgi:hypothetical protein